MTKDDIIELAREAGLLSEDEAWVSLHQEAMERFAEKVRADEREACARVIEDECHDDMTRAEEAAAIRARGEK